MGFLRRLFGGGQEEQGERSAPADPADPADPAEIEQAEREHERDLARAEAARLDELQRRQLRYADYAWTPPPQGGERRADDEDRSTEE